MGEKEKEEVTGSTPLRDTSGLIPIHITTLEELNRAEFSNISKPSAKYLLKKPSKRIKLFTCGWFLKLHREMFGEVWTWAGKLRKTEMNLGITPSNIAAEIHRLQSDLHGWEARKRDTVETAAKMHHRLVWIHPFEGGNGRWARLASNIYLRSKDSPLVVWPEERIVLQGGFRARYIRALKAADEGDFREFVTIHRGYQL